MMFTPGAVISGLIAKSSLRRGPRLENEAILSAESTAPTVSAEVAAPGAAMVYRPGPELPAATTNSVPYWAVSSLAAWLSGSVPSVGLWLPRLMLTTRTCSVAACHCIAAMISES